MGRWPSSLSPEKAVFCSPKLERANRHNAVETLELRSKRWADEPEEEGEYSEAQVQDILRSVLGLPHLVVDGRDRALPTPARPEAEEPEDAITTAGLAIGCARAGRHGLPHRPRPPSHLADVLGEEGRRSGKARRGSVKAQ